MFLDEWGTKRSDAAIVKYDKEFLRITAAGRLNGW